MIDRFKFEVADRRKRSGTASGWGILENLDPAVYEAKQSTRLIKKEKEKPNREPTITVKHKPTGLKFYGPKALGPETIEGSLPRLLWEQKNGILVRSQTDIEEGLKRIKQILLVVSPNAELKILRIIGVEIAWHFLGEPADWIAHYSGLSHPDIEKLPGVFEEQVPEWELLRESPCPAKRWRPTGITWLGQRLKIKIYDKVAEMRMSRKLNSVMRVEFVMVGHYCKDLLLPNGVPSFAALYATYRDLASPFRRFKKLAHAHDTAKTFLLCLAADGTIPPLRMNAFLADQHPSTRNRYRREMGNIEEIWESVPGIITRLPGDNPPDCPDVFRPGSTRDYMTLELGQTPKPEGKVSAEDA